MAVKCRRANWLVATCGEFSLSQICGRNDKIEQAKRVLRLSVRLKVFRDGTVKSQLKMVSFALILRQFPALGIREKEAQTRTNVVH